ncbi:uncharacterized protein BJX67DRAFT_37033 [Aspergillus lucknowensis]|uniref:Uncharacterized protein n=1 Tax=Aspergillus lucknowensis TaxID=176173 RepID=A0ABR4LW53_9EURO
MWEYSQDARVWWPYHYFHPTGVERLRIASPSVLRLLAYCHFLPSLFRPWAVGPEEYPRTVGGLIQTVTNTGVMRSVQRMTLQYKAWSRTSRLLIAVFLFSAKILNLSFIMNR